MRHPCNSRTCKDSSTPGVALQPCPQGSPGGEGEVNAMAVRKEDLERYLRGHAAAARVVERELAERLPTLSAEEALAQYEDLCGLWYRFPRPPEVDPDRLASLLKVRRALAFVAR